MFPCVCTFASFLQYANPTNTVFLRAHAVVDWIIASENTLFLSSKKHLEGQLSAKWTANGVFAVVVGDFLSEPDVFYRAASGGSAQQWLLSHTVATGASFGCRPGRELAHWTFEAHDESRFGLGGGRYAAGGELPA